MPATSGAPASRSALSCIAAFAHTRLVTPPISSTAPQTHSSRFCSWYGLGSSSSFDSDPYS